jgi:glycosyltransferase involved in cell wall biosynthesis
VLAKAYTALSRVTGRGDDAAVVIVYTRSRRPGEAEAALDAFVRGRRSQAREDAGRRKGTAMMAERDPRPLIAHVVFRFDTGGLENGVVNLINHLPRDAYRHAVVSLTDITDFRKRVLRADVQFIALQKPPGHAYKLYPKLHRLFRELRPAIVHSRNLAALETVVPAWAAGVPDPHPRRARARHAGPARREPQVPVGAQALPPFVTHYIALSRDLERYLCRNVGVPAARVEQIYNGVDASKFRPARSGASLIDGCPFHDPPSGSSARSGEWIRSRIRSTSFARSSRRCSSRLASASACGSCWSATAPVQRSARDAGASGVADLAWLPGERNDVPDILRGLDCFVLPSLSEGFSNTILEAMASGLPVIATNVGGNRELVDDKITGELVPAADPHALAQKMLGYARDRDAARTAGRHGRARVEREFSLDAMVGRYRALYDRLLRADSPGADRVKAA